MLTIHQRAVLAFMDTMNAGALHVCAPQPAWVFRGTIREDAEYAAAVFSHLTTDGVNPTARKLLMGMLAVEPRDDLRAATNTDLTHEDRARADALIEQRGQEARENATKHCDGCDQNEEGVESFRIFVEAPRIDGNGYPQESGWQNADYCPECRALAESDEFPEITQVVPSV